MTAETAAGTERVDDPAPHSAEVVGGHERKAEARVDEVDVRPGRVFEPRELDRHLGVVEIDANNKADHRLGLAVDRDHAPTSAHELHGVAAGSRAEIDDEARLLE